ncbi:heme anaerobic degradation radical SAM methyltransferase ChuW/HutW [Erwinia psidii]|uniref:Heme anaerobic degradation radical SAM methyltransferase ChuW/HutW n=1 Tax=Erwinia psidii TaxID=69224 RepID=A0A3N6SNT9_9GAMM|nr:heme anaerobic degradation radical SAM methyltransferase ChuW/HutW [Erwinia psidii]MCX8957992.1 heme anaerobic degradation radical SAM methyltransferase ChuW/HutW [Erwinia psidii]MCX8963933.1 heme anaerobic degradation radical SAM methyltransferase ChuW/HutW [Erwinia psidii]RQM39426.1 heme anaerobic degradation radical SAM methyltransferase ChuW/HutW [Erwinia psidii]
MPIDLTPWFAQAGVQAFAARRAAMPWRNTTPLPAEAVQPAWQKLLQQPSPPRKRLVYLHVPFCDTRCTFCGFYQNKFQPDEAEKYVRYLLREIDMEADSTLHQSAPIHAVYFGGGTPTSLSAQSLHHIISRLRTRLPLAPDCEITIEGRILNFDDERIDACLDAGANRFSIGIQTFDSRIRKRMARTSDRQQSVSFLEKLCRRDRAAIVCDLMFGLPGQTAESWQQDLETVRDIGLDGVDLYALNLLPSTPLAKAVENQRTALPDVSERRELYLQGAALLADYGWRQLSNSHWARTTRERNMYNLLIKQGADCLALGAGAGGNLKGQAYMMHRQLDSYYRMLDSGHKPIGMMTSEAQQPQWWRHALQGGIEAGRLDLTALTPEANQLQPLIDQWYQSGLLTNNTLCLRLTDSGRFWANNLMQSLAEILMQLTATPSEKGSHYATHPL